MLFKLNNHDYTGHIVADTFKVNNSPIYESYEDAKGRTHNVKIRDKVKGTFDLFFKTMTEYNTFLEDYTTSRSALNNTHTIYLKPNNFTDGNYDCFVSFEPTRKLNGVYSEYIGVFTLNIEER